VRNIQVLLKEGGRKVANAAREARKETLFLCIKGLSTIWQTCWGIFWDSEKRPEKSFAIIILFESHIWATARQLRGAPKGTDSLFK
jgi:hypothetical protein